MLINTIQGEGEDNERGEGRRVRGGAAVERKGIAVYIESGDSQ